MFRISFGRYRNPESLSVEIRNIKGVGLHEIFGPWYWRRSESGRTRSQPKAASRADRRSRERRNESNSDRDWGTRPLFVMGSGLHNGIMASETRDDPVGRFDEARISRGRIARVSYERRLRRVRTTPSEKRRSVPFSLEARGAVRRHLQSANQTVTMNFVLDLGTGFSSTDIRRAIRQLVVSEEIRGRRDDERRARREKSILLRCFFVGRKAKRPSARRSGCVEGSFV